MDIRVDDLKGPEIAALLQEHIEDMRSISPPESKHALDLEGLRRPEITVWTIWDGGALAGSGALKDLGGGHGEIKSMRTARSFRRRGVARLMLEHIIQEARSRGFARLSLETGAMGFFLPARRLYEGFGFAYCGPFAEYCPDRNSVFMTKSLEAPPT